MVVMSCKTDTSSKANERGVNANSDIQGSSAVSNNSTQQPSQSSTLTTEKDKVSTPAKTGTNFNSEGIPDACDLLTSETISKYVRQPANTIFPADGSSPQNPKARACFFKWDGSAIPNAGVMVQLQKNPVEEDVPEYFTYLISSKKTEGDKDPMSDGAVMYKDWPGFGDDGAYSTEAGKYVWRVGNEWAFMIAFNTVLPPKAQKVAAEAFAMEVMSKMSF